MVPPREDSQHPFHARRGRNRNILNEIYAPGSQIRNSGRPIIICAQRPGWVAPPYGSNRRSLRPPFLGYLLFQRSLNWRLDAAALWRILPSQPAIDSK